MPLDLDPYYFERQPESKMRGHETCDFSCEECDNCESVSQAKIDAELERYMYVQVYDQSDHVYCRHLYLLNQETEHRIEDGEVYGFNCNDDIPF